MARTLRNLDAIRIAREWREMISTDADGDYEKLRTGLIRLRNAFDREIMRVDDILKRVNDG